MKSIEDLHDPEVAAMFDKDGDGLVEYWAGDAGWASTRTWQIKLDGVDAPSHNGIAMCQTGFVGSQ